MKFKLNKSLTRKKDYYIGKLTYLFAMLSPQLSIILPDFLVIGAPRAGTTWLYERLTKHPDILRTPKKEIHFFDQGIGRKSIFDFTGTIQQWRYYGYNFRGGGGKLKGDFTPSYSLLPEKRITIIKKKIPDVKIIYSIRNPVDRAWSAARKNMANYYGKDRASTLSIQELRLFALSENVLKRGKYEENIANWEKYFGTDRICYLFFDEITTDPQGQLEKICHYLKIDPEKLPVEKKSKEKINKALSLDFPEDIRGELIQYYRQDIVFLENKFGKSLSHWLKS